MVDLLPDAQGLAPVDAAAEADREGLADPQPATVHEPDGRGRVWRQPGGDSFDL
jgi:hypothetical protein